MLCYDLEEWGVLGKEVEGRFKREEICVSIYTFVVQQKLTQLCKAIMFQ